MEFVKIFIDSTSFYTIILFQTPACLTGKNLYLQFHTQLAEARFGSIISTGQHEIGTNFGRHATSVSWLVAWLTYQPNDMALAASQFRPTTWTVKISNTRAFK